MASESDVKPEHSKLWHCHRTVSEMLRDRGYVVDDADIDMDLTKFVQKFESNDDVPEFRTIRRQELTKRVVRMDDEDDIMFVFFMEETNVGVKHLQIIMQRLTRRRQASYFGDPRQDYAVCEESDSHAGAQVYYRGVSAGGIAS
eukprot:965419_1